MPKLGLARGPVRITRDIYRAQVLVVASNEGRTADHAMTPFCPIDERGHKYTFHESTKSISPLSWGKCKISPQCYEVSEATCALDLGHRQSA